MDKSIVSYILDVCKALNKHHVQYLIVGGTAVAYHGYFRLSSNPSGTPSEKFDLDFWYNPTYNNYFKLINALEELGLDVIEFKNEQSPNPRNSYFRFSLENFTLDFLPSLKGLSGFIKSFDKRDVVTIDEVDILFISFDDLIQEKATDSRPKDIEDIRYLKERKKDS